MNRTFALLLCSLLALAPRLAPAAAAPPIYTDMVIAVVNEEVITLYDVSSYTHLAEERLRARYAIEAVESDPDRVARFQEELKKLRENAAERMIDIEVLWAEFQRQGYQVPNEMVEKRLDQFVTDRTGGNYQKFEEELRASRITMSKMREQIRKAVAVEMLEHDEIDRRIVITPSQIAAYYDAHHGDFAEAAKVRLALLELNADGVPADKLAAQCDTILKSAQGGTAFAELAKQYSQHGSKGKGGDLGWVEEGKLNPAFRKAFGNLAKGQLSSWVVIPGGKSVYLLQITDVSNPVVPALDEATSKRIRMQLMDEERGRRHIALVARLRGQAYIRILFKEDK